MLTLQGGIGSEPVIHAQLGLQMCTQIYILSKNGWRKREKWLVDNHAQEKKHFSNIPVYRIQTGSQLVTVSPLIPNMEVVSFDPATDTLLGRIYHTT